MCGVPNNLSLLSEVKLTYPDAVFGIGTVLDAESAILAIKAGADFLVSPCLNFDIIHACRRHGVISCLGALTPSEIIKGWEAGLDLVKVFPTNAMGGPSYIRTLKSPFPKMRLVGAGGVNLKLVEAYFAAGASLVAVDEDLMPPDAIRLGDFTQIERRAREYSTILERRNTN
jgi:2-dehydro-3-deoxyphosphogluconate aldolase/(4S)-4-hydroxy-2-oxoglutarate aldolase